jgi:hypothetical protein
MKKFRFGFGLLGIGLLAGCNLLSAAPQVSITNPGTVTTRSLTIQTTVSDNANTVELMLNGSSLGKKTSPPYTWDVVLSRANDGQNTISGYATNASGGFAYAQSQTFTVALADTIKPTVVLTSVGSSSGVALSATASDDYAVTKVEFYNGATLLATDTTAPYSYDLSLTAAGSQFPSYTAKAFDATGNNTTSNLIEEVWETSAARNDTSATAVLLNAMPVRTQTGATVSATLDSTAFGSTDPDMDFYAVNLTFAQVLKVRTYSSTGTDTVLRLFNAAGAQLAFNDAAGDYNSTDSALNWRASDSGVYYIAVSSYTNGVTPAAQGVGKQYRMTVQVGD